MNFSVVKFSAAQCKGQLHIFIDPVAPDVAVEVL
jgi:hypothetical protein